MSSTSGIYEHRAKTGESEVSARGGEGYWWSVTNIVITPEEAR